MSIYLCRHARRQAKWRKVSEEEIREAVDNPDRAVTERKNRTVAYKKIGNRDLKIVYKHEAGQDVVITVIDLTQ